MRLTTLCACTFLAACGGGGTTVSTMEEEPDFPGSAAAEEPTLGAITEVEHVEFGMILNTARDGLREVVAHPILTGVAQDYSDDIELSGRRIEHGDNLHIGRDGSTVGDRVLEAGYDYSWIGENIAQGYGSDQSVVDAWMDSDQGHRDVIRAPEAEDFGIGRRDKTWVLIMGAEHD